MCFTNTFFYRNGSIKLWNNHFRFNIHSGDNIKKNGEFISMSEIENLVLEVEGVKNAMVIPFKDETFGFKIKLFIEINSDKNNEDLKNKMQLVFNTNLTKNEEPDEIIFKKNIKKTSTGKNIKYLYR